MTSFPSLNPSIRTFSPGVYPHSPFTALSGTQVRVRNSNVMLSSQLRLTFAAITESEMLSIVAHYQAQRGSFQSFLLPAGVWSGGTSSDYQLTGYGWIYREPPNVTDYACGFHDVEILLETVPPEGTSLLGLDQVISSTIDGSAFAFNGVELVASVLFEPGVTGPPGLAETVSWSLAAGSATVSRTVSGLNLGIAVFFEKGPDSSGFNLSVAALLQAGAAAAANALAQTVTSAIAGGTATSTAQDPYFSNVSLLLHMNGNNNSTTFTDSSSNVLAVTTSGDSKISTAQSKYGGSSGYFDGSGDYLTVGPSSAFELGSADYTVEGWFYCNFSNSSTGYFNLLAVKSNSGYFELRFGDNGFENRLQFSVQDTFSGVFGLTTVKSDFTNIWKHIAVVRSTSSVSIYIDGVLAQRSTSGPETGTSVTHNIGTGATVVVGANRNNGFSFNGYISDLRITKGVARYTASFTPPAALFPNS